jgi:hypothetical protein
MQAIRYELVKMKIYTINDEETADEEDMINSRQES